jgi:hypothetical protein
MVHSSKERFGQPRRARWLALALTLAAVGLGACGDDDGDETGVATTSGVDSDVSADPGDGSEEILIKTQAEIGAAEELRGSNVSEGEVLDGSSIGDSPFCPTGTFRDAHSEDPEIGFVDRTFLCPDGGLRIGFSPQAPTTPRTQSGPWHVVSGTGAFEGLEGRGQMEIKYEPHTKATEGRETFTGTVVP